MKIVDIARKIHDDLENPSSPSLVVIATWLRDHIGDLNIALRKCYEIVSDTLESNPEIGPNEAAVLCKIYFVYNYDKLVRENLGAAATGIIEIDQAGKKVKKVNRNEVSKVYAALRKEARSELEKMIMDYRSGKFKPLQVGYIDAIASKSPIIQNARI